MNSIFHQSAVTSLWRDQKGSLMNIYKTSALIILCSVAFTGCTSSNKEKAPARAQTGTVIHISSEQEFNSAIAQGNVVVDFYMDGCGPCGLMGPIVDDLAKEMSPVKFVKIETGAFNDLTKKYGIRGVPTFLFFKAGQKIRQFTGARSKNELRNEINKTFELA